MNLHDAAPTFEAERRRHLIEATIEALADVGFKAASLSQIASRANVSTGLFAHYFGDKDGLLEATLRFMAARLVRAMRQRLQEAKTARERLYAVPDSALADREFERRTSAVWLAFWGQITHSIRYQRVQIAYQHRMLSNLRHALRELVPADCVTLHATMIASMIDGLWIRSHANPTQADAARARAIVRALIDGLIAGAADKPEAPVLAGAMRPLTPADPAASDRILRVVDPVTAQVLGSFTAARRAEIDHATEQARRGLIDWHRMTSRERAGALRRCADAIRAEGNDLARLDAVCTGRAVAQTLAFNLPRAVQAFERSCALAARATRERIELQPGVFDERRFDPIGIMAGFGQWSSPLLSACRLAAPALALGNAMIFQPAEEAPLTALRLVEIFVQAGIPPGVFTVLNGDATTRRLVMDHAMIACITPPGCDDGLPKSATVVFGNAEQAAVAVLQSCPRWTRTPDFSENRVFVQRDVLPAFRAHLLAHLKHLRVGNPIDPSLHIGALRSHDHVDQALRLIHQSVAAGSVVLEGGHRDSAGETFLAQTILDGCKPDMPIVQDKVFAPILMLIGFEDDDAITEMICRDGSRACVGIFDPDVVRAHRLTHRLQAGFCCINDFDGGVLDHDLCTVESYQDSSAANGYRRAQRLFCRDARFL